MCVVCEMCVCVCVRCVCVCVCVCVRCLCLFANVCVRREAGTDRCVCVGNTIDIYDIGDIKCSVDAEVCVCVTQDPQT